MPLTDLVSPLAVMPTLRAGNKKQALHDVAVKASELLDIGDREIFEVLLQRERLGSTGVGGGIAIPHGKLPGMDQLFGVFARLERPIDFQAMDGEPVDLMFVLLAPESAGADHLKALAQIARFLRDPRLVQSLRSCRDGAGLYALLTQPPASHAA